MGVAIVAVMGWFGGLAWGSTDNIENIFIWFARISSIASSITPIFLSISVFIALLSVQYNKKTNKYLKSIDVVLKFNDRFDDLYREQVRLSLKYGDAREEETVAFFRRFWELQEDQYAMLSLGLIESDIYVNWMISMKKNYENTEKIGTMTFKEGWERVGQYEIDEQSNFNQFFIEIFRLSCRVDITNFVIDTIKKAQDRRFDWFRERVGGV